jgi:hypothetical protein
MYVRPPTTFLFSADGSYWCGRRRAGVDAARAFGTGCFKEHRTHDLRGLSDSELQARFFCAFSLILLLIYPKNSERRALETLL